MYPLIPEKLKTAGVAESFFATAQIFCLPENFLHVGDGEELVETTDADALVKALRNAGVGVFTFMDAGIDLAAYDRRSGGKWYGTVFIREKAVIPLLVSVLSGLLVLGVSRATTDTAPLQDPVPVVHIELVVAKPDGSHAELKFDGDGKTLVDVLNALNK